MKSIVLSASLKVLVRIPDYIIFYLILEFKPSSAPFYQRISSLRFIFRAPPFFAQPKVLKYSHPVNLEKNVLAFKQKSEKR